MPGFRLTAKQDQANALLASPARHVMLFGGSRSGKTFLALRAIAIRALKAPKSRHAVMRFRFNAVKSSIIYDTWPKMLELCFPDVPCETNKSDWFAEFPNGSQVWFGGLDDKERTEKVLGQEHATIFLNECSQIPYESRNIAVTRLAQRAMTKVDGQAPTELALKMYYDENPPARSHWSYRLFVQKIDPDTKMKLGDPQNYAALQMNPVDNAENLATGYIEELQHQSARMQRRFLYGEFRDESDNALFAQEALDKWRADGSVPDLQRVVVAVDPSGSGDNDNTDNDAIGIVVAALGVDGNGYLLEDLTVKAGPSTWGRIATSAYDRHAADVIVAEVNYGGAMVKHVIQAARPRTPYKEVKASRGKVVRAEPISSLVDAGKIRLVGHFPELEEELAGFTTNGYVGSGSPNRGDAFVWAFSELFPGLVREKRDREEQRPIVAGAGWMSV